MFFSEIEERKAMPPYEELRMLPVTNFYYTLKDIVFEAAKNK